MDCQTSRSVRLPDGRMICCELYGDPSGTPVIAFHGCPGSRLDVNMADTSIITRTGKYLIVPDRPGIGGSTFQPGRKLLDTPRDVIALVDAFGIERFAVLGVSGGGAYAAACAFAIPERITSVTLVSSIAPMSAPGVTEGMGMGKIFFKLGGFSPFLCGLFARLMASGADNPERMKQQIDSSMPPPDQAVLNQGSTGDAFFTSYKECVRQGAQGLAWDAVVLGRPWGFDPSQIRLPVSLWQGEEDRNVPPAMGRYLAKTIPTCDAHFYPGEGHLSLFIRHLETILSGVI